MICPYCKNDGDKVIDSRSSGDSIRRRRECTQCKKRFTTYEYIEKAVLTVIENQCLKQRAPLSYSPCALVCDKLSVCMKWVRKRWELDMGTCKTSTHYTTTHNTSPVSD